MTRIPANGARGRLGSPLIAVAPLLAFVIVVGCGPAVGPSSPAASQVAVAPGSAGASSPAGSANGNVPPTPQPTAWPGNAVLGIDALGVADGQILAAIRDFNQGVATEDLALMRKAADGLAGLDVLLPNLDKINIFEPMRSFADRYGAAIRAISSAAKDVRAAIDAGNANSITTSSQALVTALTLYTAVQPDLAAWVEQSTTQQRLLTR
jgi:hypothetical protein